MYEKHVTNVNNILVWPKRDASEYLFLFSEKKYKQNSLFTCQTDHVNTAFDPRFL